MPILVISKGKTKKREYNYAEISNILRWWKNNVDDIHVGLEKVHAMPGQGVTSMFSMELGYGMWLGLLAAFDIPHTLVTPQAWKKVMMSGMGKEKDASRIRALQLYPHLSNDLKLKKHHGRADALLIAEYIKRTI